MNRLLSIKISAVVVLVMLVFLSFSQDVLKNPFSRYGLGFLEPIQNSVHFGLGGSKYAFVDSAYSNTANVAANSFLKKGQVFFNIDVSGRLSLIESVNGSYLSSIALLRGLDLTIPFSNRFAVSLGYRPAFSKGYRMETNTVVSGDSIRQIYLGRGVIYQPHIALSFAPLKTEKSFFAIGFETNFNFGDVANDRAVEYFSFNQTNAVNIINERVSGLGFITSLAFHHQINDGITFRFGANYQLASTWNTLSSDRLINYAGNYGVNHQFTADGPTFEVENSGTFSMPSVLGMGIGLDIHPKGFNSNRKKESRIRLNLDYEQIGWSGFQRTVGGIVDLSYNYNNTQAFRFGLEYSPIIQGADAAPGTKYLGKMIYRTGLNLNKIALPDNNLNDFGITFGLGFPVPFDKSQSSINFGLRAGQIGEVGTTPIRERYLALQVGLVITPANWERWFKKNEYK